MKQLSDYADGDIFKPGEVWQTPRGFVYRVMYSDIGGNAVLRVGSNGTGRKVIRRWDSVNNWTKMRMASESQ